MANSERPSERDQFRLLVESVMDYAIFLLDPRGIVMSWNAGAERIKGYSADEIIGRHFSAFYPIADVERHKPDRELEIAAAEGKYEEEGWRIRKDGTRFWASVLITALRDERRELVGFAKVTRDLTERRRNEQNLRILQSVTETALAHLALDDVLQSVLDTIVEALEIDTAVILLATEDGQTLAARAAHGLEEEVELGVRIPMGQGFAGRVASEGRAIVIDDIKHSQVINPILREKGLQSLVGVPLRARAKLIGVLHVGSYRPNRFQPHDVELVSLIADRIAIAIENAELFEAARAARQDADAAESAVRMRDEFLSVAAHELKTPLTAAKTAAQLLGRTFRGGQLSPTQAKALDTVEKQIGKLSRLATQLLDTVRLESGRIEFEFEDVDVSALLRDAIEQARTTTDRHTFTLDAPDGLRVRADALRLEQVFTNLLDNAVKFSPSGGAIEVSAIAATTTATITVRDHGIGVPREHRARVFDQFFQAHPNRSGLGLGLYISRTIVERHGGTMYAEQPPGAGTRFVISLPLAAATAATVDRGELVPEARPA
jgi:PAS domain S-box-containing protein